MTASDGIEVGAGAQVGAGAGLGVGVETATGVGVGVDLPITVERPSQDMSSCENAIAIAVIPTQQIANRKTHRGEGVPHRHAGRQGASGHLPREQEVGKVHVAMTKMTVTQHADGAQQASPSPMEDLQVRHVQQA